MNMTLVRNKCAPYAYDADRIVESPYPLNTPAILPDPAERLGTGVSFNANSG